jgi:hypothetical protein
MSLEQEFDVDVILVSSERIHSRATKVQPDEENEKLIEQ